jgi:hypothetical protein
MTMLSMMPGFGTVGSPILELVAAAIAVDVGLLTDPHGPPDDTAEAVFPVMAGAASQTPSTIRYR